MNEDKNSGAHKQKTMLVSHYLIKFTLLSINLYFLIQRNLVVI